MIRFRTVIERSPDVPAWDVQVRAIYVDASCRGGMFSVAFNEAERLSSFENGHEGLVIATLSAMIADSPRVNRKSAVRNMIERHLGVGGTFDACPNAVQTAESLLKWVSRGGADLIFENDKTPLRRLIVTKFLETDPHVDRGGILAHMIPHLAAFSPERLIIAHQESCETLVPTDQRGKLRERFRAVDGICTRFGYSVVGAETKVRPEGGDMREDGAHPGDLPLIVISVPGSVLGQPRYALCEKGEIEVMEIADWSLSRLGVIPDMS